MLAAVISPDAIFGAVVTLGIILISGISTLVYRSFANGAALTRIQANLDDWDVGAIKGQVDELWLDKRETWKFLKTRGELEAVNRGLVTRNSPLAIADSQHEMATALYQPYLVDLQQINSDLGFPEEDVLFEVIAKRFGEVFAKEICPILQTDMGGCVTLAIAVLQHRE